MPQVQLKNKPIVLAILDGWGLSPSWGGNAISMNNPENVNYLWRTYPHKILQAFMPIVNPGNKVGNSEIGHSCIGSGRLVKQDCSRVSDAIIDGSFYNNEALKKAFNFAKANNSKVHLIGLVSDGWVHSHTSHMYALIEMAKREGLPNVFIHAITDGIDTPPSTGVTYIANLQHYLADGKFGKIATICGRYYAMDRDGHWDRTSLAYQAYAQGIGRNAEAAAHAISLAYGEGYTDESMPPIVILENGQPVAKIQDNDVVVFFNFRADRMNQITAAFIDRNAFKKAIFGRQFPIVKIYGISLTSYRLNFPIEVAFPYIYQKNNLTEVLSLYGVSQMHIAESEKKAHVTYFFDGGSERSVPGEHVEIIPSPDTDSYDKTPEMSASKITSNIIDGMDHFDFIVANYANVDMIGHTGNIMAASRAVQILDNCIEKVYNEVIKRNGILMVTADHGNAEEMLKISNEIDPETTHTLNPVPFILIDPRGNKKVQESQTENIISKIMESKNTLADIAPTILELMGIPKPAEMTGVSLLNVLE